MAITTSTSRDELVRLMDIYHVGPDFNPEGTVEELLNDIDMWLSPADVEIIDDPYTAIRNGKRFSVLDAMGKDLLYLITHNRIPMSNVFITDLATHPIRNAFDQDPWLLLQSYLDFYEEGSANAMFSRVTGQDPNSFLNNTERVFYLTHGYGRPNRNISRRDAILRRFYIDSLPTSMLSLSDALGICPYKYDYAGIMEALSSVPLESIDEYHRTAVHEINKCRLGPGETTPDADCFQRFLISRGILPQYEVVGDLFVSNITQMNMYKKVDINKVFSTAEMMDMKNVYIHGLLEQLPDQQLLMTGYGETADLSIPRSRLRRNLLNGAYRLLTTKRYRFIGDDILFGRLVDSRENLESMTLDGLIASFFEKNALIDPFGNAVSVADAEEINNRVNSPIIKRLIERTERMRLDSNNIVSSFDGDGAYDLYTLFAETEDLDVLNSSLKGRIRDLVLYPGTAVAMTIGEYFNKWYPQYTNLIERSKDYYADVFANV